MVANRADLPHLTGYTSQEHLLLLFRSLLLCGATLLATGAQAQSPTPVPGTATTQEAALTKGEVKAMRDFKLLDFNGDGKLSRTEVKLFPRLSAAFDEADTNHDNYVSYEEVREFAVKYRAERDRQKASQAVNAAAPEPAAAPNATTNKAE